MRGWWLCLVCAACGFRPATATNAPDGSGPGTPDARRDTPPVDGPPNATVDAAPDAKIDAPGMSSLAFVQANQAASPGGSTVAVTLPAPETAGDFNIVGVSWVGTSSAVASVTDTDGNTYSEVGSALVKGGVGQLAIYDAWNIRSQGGANTVTIVTNSIGANPIAVVGEYRGVVADTSPVDVMAGHTGPPGAPDSMPANTTNAYDLIIGIGAADTNMGAGTGFTSRTSTGLDVLEDQIVTAKGSYHATATQAPGGMAWLMRMVAVKAAD